MKYLKLILLLLLISCQNIEEKELVNSIWKNCNKEGIYSEVKFTNEYMLVLNTAPDKTNFLKREWWEIQIFKINIKDNQIIRTPYKNGVGLPYNTDTLTIISNTKNSLSLWYNFSEEVLNLKRINSEINEIDSLNLKKWKNNTLTEFYNRAEIENCPDLRTEDEKIVRDLKPVEFPEEEEIEISLDSVKK